VRGYVTEALISKRPMGPLNAALRSLARPPAHRLSANPWAYGPWRSLSLSHGRSTEVFLPSHQRDKMYQSL
jgi:hypothetical protein